MITNITTEKLYDQTCMKIMKEMESRRTNCINAENVFERAFTLPIYNDMTKKEKATVINSLPAI